MEPESKKTAEPQKSYLLPLDALRFAALAEIANESGLPVSASQINKKLDELGLAHDASDSITRLLAAGLISRASRPDSENQERSPRFLPRSDLKDALVLSNAGNLPPVPISERVPVTVVAATPEMTESFSKSLAELRDELARVVPSGLSDTPGDPKDPATATGLTENTLLHLKYLMFELEATRRENSYLRKLLENQQRGGSEEE